MFYPFLNDFIVTYNCFKCMLYSIFRVFCCYFNEQGKVINNYVIIVLALFIRLIIKM